jgi:hypothetical protein
MALHHKEAQEHPANVVFALMEDRDFRYSVIRPALAKDKEALCRLTTGKHQVKGFRNIAKAPIALILPTISEEANLSAELARRILDHWLSEQQALRDAVAAKLGEAGYEIRENIFDDEGMVVWHALSDEVATAQFEGAFLPDEDSNAVMLMSLLLGWFGSDREEEEEDDDEVHEEDAEAQD